MKKPNKKELAALLQTMIILAGNRTSLTKEKHNLIESVCKKYDFYPDILEITSVDPYEIFSTIGCRDVFYLQFASYLIYMTGACPEKLIDATHLSYLSKLLSILSQQ